MPPAAIIQLGNALQEEPGGGILRIDAVNDAFFPWKGYDPELTGNVLSADKANTGCYCTCGPTANPKCDGATNPLRNSTWNIAGYCGPNNSTLSRPSYYSGDFCAPVLFDDLNHRLGGEGSDPPGLGSASSSAQTGDPSFFGMYVHDEPAMEFLPKAQSLVQYIRTYSRSTPTFGAFIYGFAQTPNQLSVWRDVDDVPMIDNYPIAYNAADRRHLTDDLSDADSGVRGHSRRTKACNSRCGSCCSRSTAIRPRRRSRRARGQSLSSNRTGAQRRSRNGRRSRRRENMAWLAIFGGTNAIMFWSAGVRGEYYIRSCPDFGSNTLACQAQHKATVVIPLLHELVEYNPFIVSTNKRAVPGLPAGVLGYESTATVQGEPRRESSPPMRLHRSNATTNRRSDAGIRQASRAARA